MGMFDYVKCARIMPDGFDGSSAEFQTKDFGCDMNTLEITDEGTLVLNAWDRWSSLERKALPPKELDFHGWFGFYDYGKDKVWREYKAKFTDGQLVEIKAITEPT